MNTPPNSFKQKNSLYQMTLIGLATAILCILSPISLPLPFSPIPISLGTLAIYFVIMVLGRRGSFLSVLLYLLLGLAGLPVFSGFTGGVGKLLGPTGGYLFGYLTITLVCGFFRDKWPLKIFPNFLGMLLGTVACYGIGSLWVSYQANLSFSTALFTSVLPFLPVDFVKLLLGLFLGLQVQKRLQKFDLPT